MKTMIEAIMKRTSLPALIWLTFLFCGPAFLSGQSGPARWTAREIERRDAAGQAPEIKPAAAVELYRPVDLVLDGAGLFVLDMDDNSVKVFSREGVFLTMFGRKGQGPGEFHRPSGLDILGEHLYVADAGNRRIQILDRKGGYRGGFKVPLSPYRVLALKEDRIIVLSLPSARSRTEKLLHCYDSQGELLWEAVDPILSGDSVYDLMRNRLFIRKTCGLELWLVPGADSRIVRRMSAAGFLLGEIKVDEDYPVKEIAIAAGAGRKRTLRPFCWNCDLDREILFLLIPERTEDGDLGPGRTVAAVDRGGEIRALVDLPVRVSRLAVEGRTVFGIDLDSRLRLFEVGPGR
ncbi:MAG: 6-bladed beta-propeller [Candidatus Aminicenantes bacterium]|nr:6-bladed beta-propeller [Candidatus Aminicenantes bacterium]